MPCHLRPQTLIHPAVPSSGNPSPREPLCFSKLKVRYGELPGSLVVRIPGFHCHGPDSIPDWRTEILQTTWRYQKRKKEEEEKKKKTWEGLKVEGLCLTDPLTHFLDPPMFPISFLPCYLPSSKFSWNANYCPGNFLCVALGAGPLCLPRIPHCPLAPTQMVLDSPSTAPTSSQVSPNPIPATGPPDNTPHPLTPSVPPTLTISLYIDSSISFLSHSLGPSLPSARSSCSSP